VNRMSKAKKCISEEDWDFLAMVDFLRADYDYALEEINQLKAGISQLLELLEKHNIVVPQNILQQLQKDELLPLD